MELKQIIYIYMCVCSFNTTKKFPMLMNPEVITHILNASFFMLL